MVAEVAKVAVKLFLGAIAVATGGVLIKRGAQDALTLKESYHG